MTHLPLILYDSSACFGVLLPRLHHHLLCLSFLLVLAFVLATPFATMTKCLAEVILWKTDAAGLIIQQEEAHDGVAGVKTAQLHPEWQEQEHGEVVPLIFMD